MNHNEIILKEFDAWTEELKTKKGQQLYNPESPIKYLRSLLLKALTLDYNAGIEKSIEVVGEDEENSSVSEYYSGVNAEKARLRSELSALIK
jgi:hypothetical protein